MMIVKMMLTLTILMTCLSKKEKFLALSHKLWSNLPLNTKLLLVKPKMPLLLMLLVSMKVEYISQLHYV